MPPVVRRRGALPFGDAAVPGHEGTNATRNVRARADFFTRSKPLVGGSSCYPLSRSDLSVHL